MNNVRCKWELCRPEPCRSRDRVLLAATAGRKLVLLAEGLSNKHTLYYREKTHVLLPRTSTCSTVSNKKHVQLSRKKHMNYTVSNKHLSRTSTCITLSNKHTISNRSQCFTTPKTPKSSDQCKTKPSRLKTSQNSLVNTMTSA